MNFSLAQLVALRELSRHGTMTAVADALGYTPGAVSQQLAALEKTVRMPLFTRVGRRVVLTDAGVVLVEHARRILDAERSAWDALRALDEDIAAPLLLGTFGSTTAALLPPVVAAVSRDHPKLGLSSRELDVDDAMAAVQKGQVDIAFGLDYPNSPLPLSPDVDVITLRSERFGLAVSPGSLGIRTASTIDLAAASEWDWILPAPRTRFGQAIRIACRQAGFEPRVTHEVTDTAVSLTLASTGLGCAPVTSMMLDLNRSVPVLRIELEQENTRRIVLIRSSGSADRPTVRAVSETIRAVVDDYPVS